MPHSPSAKKSLLLIIFLIALFSVSRKAFSFYADRRHSIPKPAPVSPPSSMVGHKSRLVQVTLSAPHTTTSWDERDPNRRMFELPLLYLHRERGATPEAERTVKIKIVGLAQTPEVQLELASHHVNISTGKPYTALARFNLPDRPCTPKTPCTIRWTLDPTTPTDLYDLRLTDVSGSLLWESPEPDRPDLALLDTWDVSLGAHVVHIAYATLFPFARGQDDLEHRLPPAAVRDFIAGTFVPIVEETWRTQVNEWGFGDPLHPDWDSDGVLEIFITTPPFALFGGTGTYTVSTVGGRLYPERRIWWFSTNESFQAYDSLTNAYKAIFAHEFFHFMQWNVLLFTGSPARRWHNLFLEAQAKAAASVQYPEIELSREQLVRYHSEYSRAANQFLTERLNSSFHQLEAADGDRYDLALYWRFLFEQNGDMDIFRAALEEMARLATPDVVPSIAHVMDQALARVRGPFSSFEESLLAFANANYALRLENGRCATGPHGCRNRYYDPQNMYLAPPLEAELKYDGDRLFDVRSAYSLSTQGMGCDAGADTSTCGYADYGASATSTASKSTLDVDGSNARPIYTGTIPTSYGMDFIEIKLDRSLVGSAMAIDFQRDGITAHFNVDIWTLGQGVIKPRALTRQPETLSLSTVYHLPTTVDTLALIITRVDPNETTDPIGSYTVTLLSVPLPVADQISP